VDDILSRFFKKKTEIVNINHFSLIRFSLKINT